MKKAISLLLVLVMACVFLCACDVKQIMVLQESDEFVVLTFESGFSGDSLLSAMEAAKENEHVEFTVKDGMVTSVNGISNENGNYWMLYTDDEENSNTAWGTIEYGEKTYASASKGVTDLKVKDGIFYIWVYQSIG